MSGAGDLRAEIVSARREAREAAAHVLSLSDGSFRRPIEAETSAL